MLPFWMFILYAIKVIYDKTFQKVKDKNSMRQNKVYYCFLLEIKSKIGAIKIHDHIYSISRHSEFGCQRNNIKVK